ncbi:MAG: hypothetical protein H0V04_06170 [Chloroflexi bacterium]|nr:hypothetical protein [Chloroflexota bacterium]
MRETLRYLTSQGKTVLISSHILPEVQQLADVVGIIDRGRLIREGVLAELLETSGHVRVRVAVSEMLPAASVLRSLVPDRPLYGIDTGPQAGWFTVALAPSRAVEVNRALAQAGLYATALEAGNDLEALFLELTRHAEVPGPAFVPSAPVLGGVPGPPPPPPSGSAAG